MAAILERTLLSSSTSEDSVTLSVLATNSDTSSSIAARREADLHGGVGVIGMSRKLRGLLMTYKRLPSIRVYVGSGE
jgi:hypothetical protein